MKYKTLFKDTDIEIIQHKTGVISFIYDNVADAMLDLAAKIFSQEEIISKLKKENFNLLTKK